MTEVPGTPSDSGDWLRKEAHNDEALYGLLHAKEIVGQTLADRERELTEARVVFTALNSAIAQRRDELGLPPEPAIEPPGE